jgi:DNA polymerase-4
MAPATAAKATILHADLDAFYASVEQLLDPTLRGQPVAVGTGVVLAASYEAKRFGVQAGMPGWRASRLCPGLRFAGGHFGEYRELGDRVVEIFRDFTPHVERISIDEAFLDVRGTVHLFGDPREIAAAIRAKVHDEVGLAVSVGVARTKHLAKVASQAAKPDGLVVVPPDGEAGFLHPLPVGMLWGVGAVTRSRLAACGIHTIGDLAETSPDVLRRLLGEAAGGKLSALAANVDPRSVAAPVAARSVGAQSALGRRRATPSLLGTTLGYLADRVAGRLRAAGEAGRTVTVRVRFPGMTSVTRSSTSELAVSTTRTLTELATRLANDALTDHPAEREITLLAVSVSGLVPQPAIQLELPFGRAVTWDRSGARTASRLAVDGSVDAIRSRFGRAAVGYAGVVLSGEPHVPEEFRELAQHEAR